MIEKENEWNRLMKRNFLRDFDKDFSGFLSPERYQ